MPSCGTAVKWSRAARWFELRKARERAHVLEGLAVALANIDPIIAVIKAAAAPPEARTGADEPRLGARGGGRDARTRRSHRVAPRQAAGRVWDERGLVPLKRSAGPGDSRHAPAPAHGLEQDKIVGEYRDLLTRIVDLSEILALPERLTREIRAELVEIRDAYGDVRRTEISRDHLNLSTEDLIEPQDMVVTLSHAGYAKAQPVSDYQAQRRGGRGKSATAVKDEDFVEKFFIAHTHDTLLCFSNRGKVYWLRVFELPQAGRGSRGKPIVNLLPLEAGEKINAAAARQAVRRAAFRLHGDQPGHGKENAPGGVLAAPARPA